MDSIQSQPCAVALALLLLVAPAGCRDRSAGASGTVEQSKPAVTTEKPAPRSAFDGARAFEHVKRQVGFGPRPAGSPALAETRKYLASELASYGLTVREEPFTAETPTGPVKMVNVIAELPGKSPDVLIIASHYDTKRMADFVGANDAGSSTGALLEIARVVAAEAKTKPLDMTLQFVLFDGEEAVVQWTDEDSTYGSRHFVEAREEDGTIAKLRGLVLLDMVGDKDLQIEREGNSTRTLTDIIWKTAAELGYTQHFSNQIHYIEDDHVPFLQAGIPAVDIIDFRFGSERANYGPGGPDNAYWHTTADTLDKVSAESLKVVGDTVVMALPRIIAALKR